MPTAVSEQIKILVELQKIDLEAYSLKKELEGHPALQKQAEQDFEKKQASLKAAEAELKALQVKQKSMEVDLQAKEDKISKLQAQLYSLKTNKEYQAMEMEIKGLKADKSVLEEEILRFFDSIEAAKAKTSNEKQLLAAEEKNFKEVVETLKKQSVELQAQVQALEEKRKAFLPNIDAKILPQYERLLKNREGLAIAPIRNNACGGCNLGLPPQVVNEARMQDKFITCESCARMLYWIP